MKFVKLSMLLIISLLILLPGNGLALPFESTGWVNPNYNDSWNPINLTGTARYTFYIDDAGYDVNSLDLMFEDDIFNLDVLDETDFTMVNPNSGWNPSISVGPGKKWGISSGSVLMNSVNDPIIVDVDYQLLSLSRYIYGDSGYAGEVVSWDWNEAQGANLPWNQEYHLIGLFGGLQGEGFILNISGGSTAPIPEPGTLLLLGSGLLGVGVFARRKRK